MQTNNKKYHAFLLCWASVFMVHCLPAGSLDMVPTLKPVDATIKSFFPNGEQVIRKETTRFMSLYCSLEDSIGDQIPIKLSIDDGFTFDSVALLSIRLKRIEDIEALEPDSTEIKRKAVKYELLFDEYFFPEIDSFRILIPLNFQIVGDYALEAGLFMKADSLKSDIPLYGPTFRFKIE